MTLDDLRVLVAVCEARSLSSAARELLCTQSAVSQHVRRLERETGVALVDRGPKGVTATFAGRVLQEAAMDALASLDGARRALEELRRGETGRLRVATGGTTVRHFMSGAVVRFRARHPRAGLDLQSASSTTRCIEAVRADRADLAFVTTGPAVRGIDQVPAVRIPWALLVPASDPLGRRRALAPAELGGIRYVALSEGSTSRRQLEEALADRGVRLVSTTSVDDWDTAGLLVELGFGEAIVPAIHASHLAGERPLRAVPITGLPPVTFGWAARRWSALGPLALELVDTVTEEMAALGYSPAGGGAGGSVRR
ncbi:MAG: LysR family transcriptional regulator [Acidimicrobiales bacterium]